MVDDDWSKDYTCMLSHRTITDGQASQSSVRPSTSGLARSWSSNGGRIIDG